MQRPTLADDQTLETLMALFVKECFLKLKKIQWYDLRELEEAKRNILHDKGNWKSFLKEHVTLSAFAKLSPFQQGLFAFTCACYAERVFVFGAPITDEFFAKKSDGLFKRVSIQFNHLNKALLQFRERKKVDLTKHASAIYTEIIKIQEAFLHKSCQRQLLDKPNYLYIFNHEFVDSLALALQFFTDLQPGHVLSPERVHELAAFLHPMLFVIGVDMLLPSAVTRVIYTYEKPIATIQLQFDNCCAGRSKKAEKTAWIYGQVLNEKFKLLDERIRAGVARKALYEENANNRNSFFSLLPVDVVNFTNALLENEANFRDQVAVKPNP